MEEVYPPHFLAYDYNSDESVLDFNDHHIGQGAFWYARAIKGELSAFADNLESKSCAYTPVAYVRVSHPDNRQNQMVIIVNPGWIPYVRVSKWPASIFTSLAQCEIDQGPGMPGIARFLPGVEGKTFENFSVNSTEARITILPLESPPSDEEVMDTDDE